MTPEQQDNLITALTAFFLGTGGLMFLGLAIIFWSAVRHMISDKFKRLSKEINSRKTKKRA